MEKETEKVKRKLEKLGKEIRERQSKYDSLIKSLMDDFKGRYFKDKEDKVTKISIFYIPEQNWINALDFKRCYYCEEEEFKSTWWKVDEDQGMEYKEHDLDKLIEAEEISKEEYDKLRKEIIEKGKKKEIENLSKKYEELKQEGNSPQS